MRIVVTGVAGFIGSTLAEELIELGYTVTGVDALTSYYDPQAKRHNLKGLLERDRFHFVEADLRTCDIDRVIDQADVVLHQAGQPGVRLSWSNHFDTYVGHNISATQRLLESARRTGLRRLVYASSSSVYGNADSYPTLESTLPRPFSPYGMTKLAGEHLCSLYANNWGVPTVSLRYFSVYGPRQRPDMAIHRLIEAALHGGVFPLFGTGEQIRDFTFVNDVVAANVMALTVEVAPGTILNISGGSSVSMNDVAREVESATCRPVEIDYQPTQPGDVYRTGGSNEMAQAVLGWQPRVALREGIAAQIAWHQSRASHIPPRRASA